MDRLGTQVRTVGPAQSVFVPRETSGLITENAHVIQVLSKAYLPMRHGNPPEPMTSYAVETSEGRRYVIQIRGRQTQIDIQFGYQLQYTGELVSPRVVNGVQKGQYFEVRSIQVTNKVVDPYLLGLEKERLRMVAEDAANTQGPKETEEVTQSDPTQGPSGVEYPAQE